MSMSVQSPTVVWVTVQPAKRRRSEMSKRNKINKNGGGNGRNGKMRQKGAVRVRKWWLMPSNISEEQHMRNITSREYPIKINDSTILQ
jgi:hypothetical protein